MLLCSNEFFVVAGLAPPHDAAKDAGLTKSLRRSLYHLVGAGEQAIGHGEAESLGGPQIDDKLELRRLHDRQVGWLVALKDFTRVLTEQPKPLGDAGPVTQKTPRNNMFASFEDRRHAIA